MRLWRLVSFVVPVWLGALFGLSASGFTYYVATNGSDAAGGLSWATAKQTIQAAVDAAISTVGPSNGPAVVVVSNGTYATGGRVAPGGTLPNRVVATNAVTITSANGPSVTTIDGSYTYRCVYLGSNAVLSGFTLTGGATFAPGGIGVVPFTDDSGGGVLCQSGGSVVSNCVINGNGAQRWGGGAFRGSYFNCTISSNICRWDGGGVAGQNNSSDLPMLYDCRIIENYCFTNGGGVAYAMLDRCYVASNSTGTGNGGGAWYGTLVNCLVVGNSANLDGGGLHSSYGNGCTIYDNTSYGGVARAGGSVSGAVYNCIVYHNRYKSNGVTLSYGNDVYDPGFANTLNSCAPNLPAINGNISSNPLFVDAAARDFRLQDASPCINGGDNSLMLSTMDYARNIRIVNGSVDMGALENQSVVVTVVAVGALTTGGGTYTPGTNVTISAVQTNSHWQFLAWNDGNTNLVRNITVPLTNITYTANWIQYDGPVTFYVTTNGADSSDGLSWAHAKATIAAAAAAAYAGDTVLVSNGVYATGSKVTPGYSTSNRVVIANNVAVRSVNGPAVTIIKGAKNGDTYASVRCLYMSAGSIAGFTLTNGYAPSVAPFYDQNRGGGGAFLTGGSMSNCIITGNSASSLGGGSYGGTLYNCTLSGNSATNAQGGGACSGNLFDCTISGNSAYDGGGVSDSTLNRCRLTGNLAANDYGGGSYLGTLNNCLLLSNSAYIGGGAVGSGLNNCSLVANSAVAVGGVYGATLTNCIVYFNSDSSGFPNYYFGATFNSTFDHSCTTPIPTNGGTGNFTNQPRFVATNDYHLATNSPCVNAGSNAGAPGLTDLDGNSRFISGIVDLGAYENQFATGYWAWASAINNGQFNTSDSASGDGYPNLLKYATGSSATSPDNLARISYTNLFALRFNRNTNASDVTLIVEASSFATNNAAWSGIATNKNGSWGGATNVTEIPGTPAVVTVQDTAPAATNRFLRLRVTRP